MYFILTVKSDCSNHVPWNADVTKTQRLCSLMLIVFRSFISMALHLLEATLTQGPSCSADDLAELEVHIRNEIERYVQLEIERELYELAQITSNESLLTSTNCSTYLAGGELNNETSKKRIKADSDAAKGSAKTSMELDQQLTELKNKYLTVSIDR